MPIATSKIELLDNIEKEYDRLKKTLAEFSAEQMSCAGVCHAWSAKDVLAHLTEWNDMFFSWYERGCRGESLKLPADDLKWNQTPELNDRIYRKWKDLPLDEIKSAFEKRHARALDFAQNSSEEHLFTPKLYPWMSTWPLSRWLAAVSSSHYAWANKRLKTFIKSNKSPEVCPQTL